MARRTRIWHMVQASKAEALIAVDHYNTNAERRSLEAFVVHMHLAWLYLLHAEFTRDGVDFRYWDDRFRPPRLHRIDGEPKTWEVAKCASHRWRDVHDPIRLNLEFFIGLRNKIEHRYQERIGLAVAGHAQALLLNYEVELTGQFGPEESLSTQLRFPVYLSSLTPEGVAAVKRLRAKLPANATRYINDFHAGLAEEIAADSRFEFRVNLIPQLGPKTDADLAINFVRAEDLTPAQKAAFGAGAGVVATRVKLQPVQNRGLLRPAQAVAKIADSIPGFTMADFVWAWKHFGVRPPAGDPNPSATDERYCVYDEPHHDYLYTDAWIRKVIRRSLKPPGGAT